MVDFSVGDRVFGTVDHGAYAELITVPANARIAPIPPGIDFEAAAAAPYGAGTALTFLREIAAVVPGERVLVVGASGGVGRYAVQIARHLGAEVTAVCSARHAEIVRALGASEVIDYRREDYTRRGERWDVIFDTTSGDGFHAARRCLSERGRYVTVYMNFKVMAQTLISRMLGGPRVRGGVVMGSPALLRGVADLLAAGAISPRIAGRYPLSQLAPAHEALEEGNPGGDIVVAMAPRPRFEPLTTAAVPA